MGNWIFGVAMAVLSMVGLLVASRAHDQMLSVVGFLLTAFGLAFIFWLIARNTGNHHGQLKH
jgi:uncharacterized membrane protein YfcA